MVSNIETNPANFSDWSALHALLTAAFADMATRIDPPSSLTRLDAADLARKATTEDLFVIRNAGQPVACLFGEDREACYYIGKLAVAASHRQRGLARALIVAASTHAAALGHTILELQTRVELTENHACFRALGFHVTDATAHAGYDRPTSLTFQRAL